MHLTARHRLNHSLEFVSQRLTDFQRFEALAEAQGILQDRRGDLQKPLSCNWALEFWFRGKMRYPELSVPRFDTPQDWSFELQERPRYSFGAILRLRLAMKRNAFCAFPARCTR